MDFLIGIMKDFVSRFFTMFPFYTSWNYQNNFWFSDVTLKNENKMWALGRNRSIFLTHFNPIFLFYTPCKRHKTLGFLLFPQGIKSEHWEEIGEIILFMKVIYVNIYKIKNTFFKEQLSATASRFLNGLQRNPFS